MQKPNTWTLRCVYRPTDYKFCWTDRRSRRRKNARTQLISLHVQDSVQEVCCTQVLCSRQREQIAIYFRIENDDVSSFEPIQRSSICLLFKCCFFLSQINHFYCTWMMGLVFRCCFKLTTGVWSIIVRLLCLFTYLFSCSPVFPLIGDVCHLIAITTWYGGCAFMDSVVLHSVNSCIIYPFSG